MEFVHTADWQIGKGRCPRSEWPAGYRPSILGHRHRAGVCLLDSDVLLVLRAKATGQILLVIGPWLRLSISPEMPMWDSRRPATRAVAIWS